MSEDKGTVTVLHSAAEDSKAPNEGAGATGGLNMNSMEKGSFQMLSFRNLPECFGESCHEMNGHFERGVNEPYLRCGSVFSRRTPVKVDLKSTKGVNAFVESAKEAPQAIHMVTSIDINGGPTGSFHVLIDSVTHGPFRKISITQNDVGACTHYATCLLYCSMKKSLLTSCAFFFLCQVILPIATYLPFSKVGRTTA